VVVVFFIVMLLSPLVKRNPCKKQQIVDKNRKDSSPGYYFSDFCRSGVLQ